MLKKISLFFIGCLFSITAMALDFPQLTGQIVDEAHILSNQTKQEILSTMTSDQQFVVVTLNSLRGQTIEEYGVALGRYWGIGDKNRNDGLLLIVAPNERKVRIEVGYGLESVITDFKSTQIIQNDILPLFKKGDYNQGILAGVLKLQHLLQHPIPANSLEAGATSSPQFNDELLDNPISKKPLFTPFNNMKDLLVGCLFFLFLNIFPFAFLNDLEKKIQSELVWQDLSDEWYLMNVNEAMNMLIRKGNVPVDCANKMFYNRLNVNNPLIEFKLKFSELKFIREWTSQEQETLNNLLYRTRHYFKADENTLAGVLVKENFSSQELAEIQQLYEKSELLNLAQEKEITAEELWQKIKTRSQQLRIVRGLKKAQKIFMFLGLFILFMMGALSLLVLVCSVFLMIFVYMTLFTRWKLPERKPKNDFVDEDDPFDSFNSSDSSHSSFSGGGGSFGGGGASGRW